MSYTRSAWKREFVFGNSNIKETGKKETWKEELIHYSLKRGNVTIKCNRIWRV